ncbi:uncharacterized protein LOC143240742 isoform X4 [Tachypleus tridentatus]|uniref:uncharacterized protein LOC143240742 isoform X4 n=1 Tax=Tachypleus tridentatus TaxID=6853 RepID=UPI003FD5D2B1
MKVSRWDSGEAAAILAKANTRLKSSLFVAKSLKKQAMSIYQNLSSTKEVKEQLKIPEEESIEPPIQDWGEYISDKEEELEEYIAPPANLLETSPGGRNTKY